MVEQQQNQAQEVEPVDMSEAEMESMDNSNSSENSEGNATEEQQEKYNEIASKSYGDLRSKSDDFLTWLLILLGVIEPEDLGNDGKVKQGTLEHINDDENKKKEFEKKYEEYTGKKAPENISTLEEKDIKKMNEEVDNYIHKKDPYLNLLAENIVECKRGGTIEETIKAEEKLKKALIPDRTDLYETYTKAIQAKVKNPNIDLKDALAEAKKQGRPPIKPKGYFSISLSKEARRYRNRTKKYNMDQKAKEEIKKTKELMSKGTYGKTGKEVEKKTKTMITDIKNDGEIDSAEEVMLENINKKASERYEIVLKEYEKNGQTLDSTEQTRLYERCFASAVISKEEELKEKQKKNGKRFFLGFNSRQKKAIKKMKNKIEVLNGEHRLGCRDFANLCDKRAKLNARNIMVGAAKKKGIDYEMEREELKNEKKNIRKEKIEKLKEDYKNNKKEEIREIESNEDFGPFKKKVERLKAFGRRFNKFIELQKNKINLSKKHDNRLNYSEKKYIKKHEEIMDNETENIEKENTHNHNFTTMKHLRNIAASEEGGQENEMFERSSSHVKTYKNNQKKEESNTISYSAL